MAATRKFDGLDWEIIREEFIAGQLSIKEIARRHGCSDTAIHKKARELQWQRNLSARVREQVREKLVRVVCGDNANANQPATDDQIVEAAADRGAEVVRLNRVDINNLRALEQRLLAELGDASDPPMKVHVSAHQGQVTLTPLLVTTTEKCAAFLALASATHKRIQLERQAYNLDDEGAQRKQSTLAEILAEIDGQARELPGGSQE
jgi:hypothetical protein